jgi:hypothetical protein
MNEKDKAIFLKLFKNEVLQLKANDYFDSSNYIDYIEKYSLCPISEKNINNYFLLWRVFEIEKVSLKKGFVKSPDGIYSTLYKVSSSISECIYSAFNEDLDFCDNTYCLKFFNNRGDLFIECKPELFDIKRKLQHIRESIKLKHVENVDKLNRELMNILSETGNYAH